jgi:hypothetical protein
VGIASRLPTEKSHLFIPNAMADIQILTAKTTLFASDFSEKN